MKKKFLICIGFLSVIFIILIILIVSNIGPIIKTAVNTYGPDITRTKVYIENVGISVFSGTARLKGFLLGNPRGFKTKEAIKVKSISVDVDKESLANDTIIVNSVRIFRPEITYEKENGTDNFSVILRNVQSGIGSDKKTGVKTGEKKSSKKIVIRDLVIRDAAVKMVFGGTGVTVPLPDIHMTNVGSKKGASPAMIADEVLKTIYGKILSINIAGTITNGTVKGIKTGSGRLKSLFGK